ncbi:MAG TPA: hypothetical protein VIJ02_15420 [Thermoanaerobaculia bacterium]
MHDSRIGRRVLSLLGAYAILLPLAAYADIEITLKNSFIEKFKNRVTIDANFTVDKAHPKPNPASKDGDLHAAGRAPEIGLAAVAEVMNARFQKPALDLIHGAESSGQPLQVRGVWRLWCEHGGDVEFKQGDPLQPFNTTNPPHVFEVHPLLKVGGQDLADSLEPIDGFTYKDAEQAFRSYENLKSHITPGASTTTIRTTMAGFNYVEFAIQLNEDPTHAVDDGLTVKATILNLDGELLVRERRMVFAAGTQPFERVKDLHKGDTLHVVGIPRIDLALVSFRASHQDRPGILDWSLPYEMVIVAAFDDTPQPEDTAAASVTPAPAVPAPEEAATSTPSASRSESDVIDSLTRMLSERPEANEGSGACEFRAGTRTFCVVSTKEECAQIGGRWHAGKTCQ